MSLHDGKVRVLTGDHALSPAYLVRFPEDVWGQLEKAALTGGAVSISLDDSLVS